MSDPKHVVTRLIDEVINGGRLELIDDLYTPEMAAGAKRWIAPRRRCFCSDCARRPDP